MIRHLVSAAFLAIVLLSACSKTPEQQYAEHRARADTYWEQGRTSEALLEYKSALQLNPEDVEVKLRIGEASLKQGDVKGAFLAFREITEARPDLQEAQIHLGNLYLLAKSPEQATVRAETVLAVAPENTDALVLMGKVLAFKGDMEGALAKIDQAIAIAPKNLHYRLTKLTMLMSRGRLSEAMSAVDQYLEKDPSNSALLLVKAKVAELSGDRGITDSTYAKLLVMKDLPASIWISYGEMLLNRGQVESALGAFKKASELDEEGLRGLVEVVQAYLKLGDAAGARQAVDTMLQRRPGDTQTKFLEGRVLMAEGRFSEASVVLREALKEEPDHAEGHYYLGLASYSQGERNAARAEVARALEIRPKFQKAVLLKAQLLLESRDFEGVLTATDRRTGVPMIGQTYFLRGSALLGLGRVDEATRLFEGLAAELPDDSRVQKRLGLCYLAGDQLAKALRVWRRALVLNPADTETLSLITQIMVLQGSAVAAIQEVQGYLEANGDSAEPHLLLGLLHAEIGDLDAARQHLKQCIEINPGMPEAYAVLAGLRRGPTAQRDAIVDLDASLAHSPRYLPAWVAKGQLHHALGEDQLAEDAYRKALEVDPDFLPALNNLAYLLTETGGNLDEALKFAEHGVELAPESPALADTLGWIYVKKGVHLTALTYLEPAAEKLIHDPSVWYHLGTAYAGAGQRERAARWLAKAIEKADGALWGEDAERMLEDLKSNQ